jgi:hypothetical protein
MSFFLKYDTRMLLSFFNVHPLRLRLQNVPKKFFLVNIKNVNKNFLKLIYTSKFLDADFRRGVNLRNIIFEANSRRWTNFSLKSRVFLRIQQFYNKAKIGICIFKFLKKLIFLLRMKDYFTTTKWVILS